MITFGLTLTLVKAVCFVERDESIDRGPGKDSTDFIEGV